MKLILWAIIAFVFATSYHNLLAQDAGASKTSYTVWKHNGVGIQYGAGSGWLVYKRYFSKFALEANLGYYTGGSLGFIPRLQVNFLKPYDLKVLKYVQWYWGIGAHYQVAEQPYFEIGPNLLAGLEYNIIDWHISIYGDAGVSTGYRGKNQEGFVYEPQLRGGVRFRW